MCVKDGLTACFSQTARRFLVTYGSSFLLLCPTILITASIVAANPPAAQARQAGQCRDDSACALLERGNRHTSECRVPIRPPARLHIPPAPLAPAVGELPGFAAWG